MVNMEMGEALTVTLSECPDLSGLEAQWRSLENESAPSFFTSWSWIGPWLRRLEPYRRPHLLRATCNQRVVGMGFFVPKRSFRLRLLPSRCLHLHATGEGNHDDICIEHNGLLVSQVGAAQIEAAMLSFLCSPQHGWDQIHLPGLSVVPSLQDFPPQEMVMRQESDIAYFVDLSALRESGGNYVSQRSKNTRSQIKRCNKEYATLGPITLTAASDPQQAMLFFDRLKEYHQRAWTARGAPGAFANPLFESYHAQLIDRGFSCGEVQLLRIHAAEHDIGYLYNFVYRGRVMCYQSGFNYDLIQKNNHPGMAAHAQAIQYYSDSGLDVYDFLAGAARYKQQLASNTYPVTSVSIHRNTISLRLEQEWRRVKKKLFAAPLPRTGEQEVPVKESGDRRDGLHLNFPPGIRTP